MFGRRVIYTDAESITDDNVIDVLITSFNTHLLNQEEIEYLYNYYKGDQPILDRIKEVRPEICNKIVENRANEIVSFKTGYLMGEPVQYVSRDDRQDIADNVTRLNDYMLSEDKSAEDEALADWFHICGTSYRMVLPDAQAGVADDEAPFEVYTLDPRYAFVVYQNSLGNPLMMGVKYITRKSEDGTQTNIFSVYTDSHYYEITSATGMSGSDGWKITKSENQVLGIPIVEYPLNAARLGAFEVVLPLLDAINTTESNRLDGVEQFIQALMLFHNVDISSSDFADLRAEGAIKFKDLDANLKAEIKYLTAELNQGQTQTLVDHMYDTVLTICGMPNRNGGSSTSDTGTAVIYRDGWSAAESRAKKTESIYKKSEKKFLKLVLRICRDLSDLDLKLSAVEIRFTRRNYENITEKANVLIAMLNNPKIAPQLAFTHCGMFSDPNIAYQMSVQYMAEQEAKQAELKESETQPGLTLRSGGEGDSGKDSL